jgi:hypothetical protein
LFRKYNSIVSCIDIGCIGFELEYEILHFSMFKVWFLPLNYLTQKMGCSGCRGFKPRPLQMKYDVSINWFKLTEISLNHYLLDMFLFNSTTQIINFGNHKNTSNLFFIFSTTPLISLNLNHWVYCYSYLIKRGVYWKKVLKIKQYLTLENKI